MKRYVIQVVILAAVLLAICGACRLFMGNEYVVRFPASTQGQGFPKVAVQADNPGIVSWQEPENHGNYITMRVKPEKPGEVFLELEDEKGDPFQATFLKVGPMLTVYDTATGGFTGDTVAIICVTIFWFAVSAIMAVGFFKAKGPAFYAYTTIFFVGFFLFALGTGIMLGISVVQHLLRPWEYPMSSVYSFINTASCAFLNLTFPLILAFAVAMAVSNIALLRHERFRPQNVLGLLVAFLMVAGAVVFLWMRNRDFMGSESEWRIRNTLENSYATVYVYFECMLAGSAICGITAARHEPEMEPDYILVLGCQFRKDGTLPPLLRGRVDRAIGFWRKQKARTGREATFIPSGGQGPNEVMPEAEAMRRYMLEQGIPEKSVLPESRSKNTYENMAFSRDLIRRTRNSDRVIYATTNYHVFRSGIWAARAGLKAEGIGSKTKWWYWPNAFMRECVGLIKNRIWEEIFLLIALNVFFVLLSLVLS